MDEAAALIVSPPVDAGARLWRFALSAVLGLTLVRLAFLAYSPLQLDFEEAQYADWAANPAWGYYSKPPLIAWLIALMASICGDGAACIRSASPVLHGATALILGACGAALAGRRIGAWTALVYATLPGVSFSSMLVTTDVPLMFFWSIALYAFLRLRRDGWLGWAAIGGVAAGLGCLSKYAMLLFFAGVLAYLLLSPQGRRQIGWRGPMFMAALALGSLLPNVAWNVANGWITLKHTAGLTNRTPIGFDLDKFLVEFVGGQIALFGPLLFYLLLREGAVWWPAKASSALPDGRLDRDDRLLLLCLSLLFLVPFAVLAALNRADANWTAYAYVAASVLVAGAGAVPRFFRWLRGSVAVHAGVGLGMYSLILMTPLWPLAPAGMKHALERMTGWQELGRVVAAELTKDPSLRLLLPDDRRVTAWLIYYAHVKPNGYVVWNDDGFPDSYFEQIASLMPGDPGPVLLVAGAADAFTSDFDHASLVRTVDIPLFDDLAPRHFFLYRLTGFHGYGH